ncbi:MAG TPA: hypothetical protein VN256_01750 [Pyrinomonadaceae bacterium]|nr:hypothetical protein [Pyrinomonadaceae bacterium]
MTAAAKKKNGEGAASPAGPPGSQPRPPGALARTAEEIKEQLGEAWLPGIYRERILPMRTRSHHLSLYAKRPADVEIQHTLLGVELKVGRRRMSCPDLATARYLAVFARANCPDVAVPYDISRISGLADELESAWHRMLLLVEHAAEGRSAATRSRLRNLLIEEVRREVGEAGAGTARPQFNQETRQRPARSK